MRHRSKLRSVSSRAWIFLLASLAILAVSVLVTTSQTASAEGQDGRPRRSGSTGVANPAATPVPTATPATKPVTTSTQTQVNRPSPTPAQSAKPTPFPRTLPELGEPPPPPPTPTPTPPEEYGEGERVVVDTELVTLNVRVIDRNNRPVNNVSENEFHIYEDGVEQPIEFFTREEVPIGYGLAVDTSGSLRSQLQSVIDAGKSIVNSNKPGDETFVIRFIDSDKIELRQDFTASKDLLTDALEDFYIEGGQTAVIDAVYLAAEHAAQYKKGDDDRRRRALILITDGEDRGSRYTQTQLFSRLREVDVQIYIIGFVNELDREGGLIKKSSREKAINLINKIATETAGRAFFPQTLSEIPQIANEIVRDLRTQYVVAYNPTNKARDGSYRAIRVTVSDAPSRDKRIALTRSGRVAPIGGGPRTPKAPTPRLPATTNTESRKTSTTKKTP